MEDLTIIGFGMSTTCFLLYLIDNNLINKLKKICIIEKNESICFNSLKYLNVNSNSTLKSMISIFKNDIFKTLIDEIEENYNLESFINLYEFNKLLIKLTTRMLYYLKNFDNIKVMFNYEVKNIDASNEDMLVINEKIITKKIILATGGDQSLNFYKSKDINNILVDKKVILSNDIYNSKNLLFFKNKNILIIGSSHSSLSIIDALLKHNIEYKSIILYSRNKIKVFYKCREECINNNDDYESDDLCTETGFINRYDGLRENSKEIFLNLDSYNNITKINSCDNIDLSKIDYIIPCWGYYKKIPKINNNKYFLNIDSNLSSQMIIDHKMYKNIFLLGLSANPKIKTTQKSFDKSIDGIWLYYNVISEKLFNDIISV